MCFTIGAPQKPEKTWSAGVLELLINDGAVVTHERLTALWLAPPSVRLELCDMLHDGTLRLAPLRDRAWGGQRKFTRQAKVEADEAAWKSSGAKPKPVKAQDTRIMVCDGHVAANSQGDYPPCASAPQSPASSFSGLEPGPRLRAKISGL